ncbi:MAG: DNA translocase FtsK 4TM domain-containing protein, partial [Candidatus Omnitrophica bacterium]|nr:DNA translocase FtsK 4TM domain-containing protein [Candidatus Omnitrophota bacterium]
MNRPEWTGRLGSILLASAGVFLTLCLVTYRPADVPLLSSSPTNPPGNLGGVIGVWLGFLGRGGFGWASLVLSLLLFLWAWRLWRGRLHEAHGSSLLLGTLSLMSSVGTLLALMARSDISQTALGGVAGFLLARSGVYYLGTVGTVLSACCVGLLSWLVVSGQTLGASGGWGWLRRMGSALAALTRGPVPAIRRLSQPGGAGGRTEIVEAQPVASLAAAAQPRVREEAGALDEGEGRRPPRPSAPPRIPFRSMIEPKPKTIPTPPRRQTPSGFQLPPHELLTTPPPIAERQISENLQTNAKILEETLREFGIEASVVNIDRGPVVTRYELTPAPGVKLTKIVSLADDLALVMKAASCHIVAPIPGKGRVGIDVPNTTTTVVYLKEIITAHEFTGNPSSIALPIGKDISGQAIVADLHECPHLLIAGATGSGKTVCLNSLLLGILTRASPEQVRFLMIDPKMVELSLFNEIPHLIAPVVTT